MVTNLITDYITLLFWRYFARYYVIIFFVFIDSFVVGCYSDFDNMERWPLPHPLVRWKWHNYRVTPEKIVIEGKDYPITEIL